MSRCARHVKSDVDASPQPPLPHEGQNSLDEAMMVKLSSEDIVRGCEKEALGCGGRGEERSAMVFEGGRGLNLSPQQINPDAYRHAVTNRVCVTQGNDRDSKKLDRTGAMA